jgi:GYF domain 2
MQVWYYHSPGQGKIGPLTVEQIQQHFRERRLMLDMLVWREGLREWQPAERLIDELGLIGLKADPAQPPPVPPQSQSLGIVEIEDTRFARTDPRSGAAWPNATPQTAPAKSGVSGCLIAAIAIGVVGLVLLAILAAIALPAYQDYVKRAKQAQQAAAQANTTQAPTIGPPPVQNEYDAEQLIYDDGRVRRLLAEAVGGMQGGQCPQDYEFEMVQARSPDLGGRYEISLFSADPYRCAYVVRFGPTGSEWANASAMYVAQGERGDIQVSCRSNTTDARLKPPGCN